VDVNGLDGIIITKLDVLDSFEEIKVCVAYEYEGKSFDYFPASLSLLEGLKPVYKSFKGWLKNTKGAKSLSQLPREALDYLDFIQSYLGVPIVMLSTGPQRDEFFWLEELALK
ncbi:MAG: adenylosuccinate synthetase, partial [Aquificaceae bacterium]